MLLKHVFRRSSTSRPPSSVEFYNNRMIEHYASLPTKKVTLHQLIAFGRHMNTFKLLKSANYVRHELCVRLAHRIRSFQSLPFIIGTHPRMEIVYRLYHDAFETFRRVAPIESMQANREFCLLLRSLLDQHLVVIPHLSVAMTECQHHLGQPHLDRFMNDMLRTRIGRRVLAEQHLILSEQFERRELTSVPAEESDGRIGIIDTRCHARQVVLKCVALAQEVVSLGGTMRLPDVVVDGSADVTFLYIPDHLEYILFELLKNALFHQSRLWQDRSSSMPPVQVTVCPSHGSATNSSSNHSNSNPSLSGLHLNKDETDAILFRISDQGGGISKSILPQDNPDRIWSFHNHTFSAESFPLQDEFKLSVPAAAELTPDKFAGKLSDPVIPVPLKLGLQLARVYAQYWGGELRLMSLYGYGTDAYVRLQTGGQREEKLTVDQD